MNIPVYQELGIKKDTVVIVINSPNDYDVLVEFLPLEIATQTSSESYRLIHLIVALKADFSSIMARLAKDEMLWTSWVTGALKLSKNINENHIRDFGLSTGLVDEKVYAIDQDWSGLKFML